MQVFKRLFYPFILTLAQWGIKTAHAAAWKLGALYLRKCTEACTQLLKWFATALNRQLHHLLKIALVAEKSLRLPARK